MVSGSVGVEERVRGGGGGEGLEAGGVPVMVCSEGGGLVLMSHVNEVNLLARD